MIRLFKDPIFKNFDTIDQFINDVNKTTSSYISTNIVRNDEDYRIQIAVPGLSKEDVKITTKDGILTILHECEDETKHFFVDSFKKTYSIPDDADEKNITGKVENGIIEITLPKTKKKPSERVITVI
jgi:HSP20 family protein